MQRLGRFAGVALAFALVVSACGGGTGATTTSSTTTSSSSSTTTSSTTTTTTMPVTGTVEDLVGLMVEDPLFGTGFHLMEWEGNFLWSVGAIDGTPGDLNKLAVGDIMPAPTVAGLPTGGRLLDVWIQNYDGDIIPNGTAVYTETPSGWAADFVVTSAMVFAFIETTTDYQADPVAGPVQVGFTITSWDGTAGPSFVATVEVYDYFDGSSLAFEGEVACIHGDPLDCTLTSDDGVLRPGDEGEDVEALQEDLIALGYYAGPIDGIYDGDVEDAVYAFQQDYRLARDGKAGPNTLGLIEDIISGDVEIVMAGPSGVGDVLFGVDDTTGFAGLIDIFGSPDSTEDWYVDACDGHDWFKATWDGFTAIFTDRDGFRSFDGWHVDDVGDLPSWLYFEYGLRPTTTWSYLKSIGAGWEPAYSGVWYQNDIGYNNGRLSPNPAFPNEPATSATITSFGTGTGAFVSC